MERVDVVKVGGKSYRVRMRLQSFPNGKLCPVHGWRKENITGIEILGLEEIEPGSSVEMFFSKQQVRAILAFCQNSHLGNDYCPAHQENCQLH